MAVEQRSSCQRVKGCFGLFEGLSGGVTDAAAEIIHRLFLHNLIKELKILT